jgi:protein gp37
MAKAQQHSFLLLTKRINRLLTIQPFPKPYLSNAPNVWLGVTVVNQAEADEKIPILLQIPAAVRWLSIEPMLGPVNISKWLITEAQIKGPGYEPARIKSIDWVVLGGETGPGARPMRSDWGLSIKNQCVSAGIPFFFKSWGSAWGKYTGRLLDGKIWNELP